VIIVCSGSQWGGQGGRLDQKGNKTRKGDDLEDDNLTNVEERERASAKTPFRISLISSEE